MPKDFGHLISLGKLWYIMFGLKKKKECIMPKDLVTLFLLGNILRCLFSEVLVSYSLLWMLETEDPMT